MWRWNKIPLKHFGVSSHVYHPWNYFLLFITMLHGWNVEFDCIDCGSLPFYLLCLRFCCSVLVGSPENGHTFRQQIGSPVAICDFQRYRLFSVTNVTEGFFFEPLRVHSTHYLDIYIWPKVGCCPISLVVSSRKWFRSIATEAYMMLKMIFGL